RTCRCSRSSSTNCATPGTASSSRAAAPGSALPAEEGTMKPATAQKRIEGVLSPVITPFKRDLSPDPERFVKHCKWLMKSGCAGLAVFGTNSEANSMSVEEKLELLEALVKG